MPCGALRSRRYTFLSALFASGRDRLRLVRRPAGQQSPRGGGETRAVAFFFFLHSSLPLRLGAELATASPGEEGPWDPPKRKGAPSGASSSSRRRTGLPKLTDQQTAKKNLLLIPFLTPVPTVGIMLRRTVLGVLVVAALAVLAVPASAANPEWEKCMTLPILGETCLEVVVDPQALTVNVSLYINGNEVATETLSASHFCLDDQSLLKLLELIPALAPYKPIIDDIIKAEGFIPAEVLSVCIDIENLDVQPHEATGCPKLTANIICLESKCLWTGQHQFGCFDLHY